MNTETVPSVPASVPPDAQNKPPTKPTHKQIYILGLLLIVLVVGVASIITLRLLNKSKSQRTNQLAPASQTAPVDITAGYQNPFAQNAQYANPFESYDNPFATLKQP